MPNQDGYRQNNFRDGYPDQLAFDLDRFRNNDIINSQTPFIIGVRRPFEGGKGANRRMAALFAALHLRGPLRTSFVALRAPRSCPRVTKGSLVAKDRLVTFSAQWKTA